MSLATNPHLPANRKFTELDSLHIPAITFNPPALIQTASSFRPLRGLVISPYSLIPADHGGKVHVDAHIRQLKALGHDIWYLGAGLSPGQAEDMARVWGDRFVCAPRADYELKHRIWGSLLRRLRIIDPVDGWYHSSWSKVAAELARRERFDYIIVHYIFLTRFFLVFPLGVRRIIDTHDSFIDRQNRLAAQGVRNYGWHCTARGQLKTLLRGEIIMANQAEEARLFEAQLNGRRKVVTVGHPVSWDPQPEAKEPTIGFLGSGNPQNRVGLAWFIKKAWPLVRVGFPTAELLVAGTICEVEGVWSQAPGVRLMGRVEDVRAFHRLSRLEINPVFAGSGLKIKTLESLASGRALVSMPEGVVGISHECGAFVVADTAEAFASAVLRLLGNPEARNLLRSGAEKLLRDWNHRQQAAIESLFDGL